MVPMLYNLTTLILAMGRFLYDLSLIHCYENYIALVYLWHFRPHVDPQLFSFTYVVYFLAHPSLMFEPQI